MLSGLACMCVLCSESAVNAMAAIFTVGGVVMLITTIAFAQKRGQATALDAEQAKGLLAVDEEATTYGTQEAELASAVPSKIYDSNEAL